MCKVVKHMIADSLCFGATSSPPTTSYRCDYDDRTAIHRYSFTMSGVDDGGAIVLLPAKHPRTRYYRTFRTSLQASNRTTRPLLQESEKSTIASKAHTSSSKLSTILCVLEHAWREAIGTTRCRRLRSLCSAELMCIMHTAEMRYARGNAW